jgi:hypothetical protein
MKKQWVRIIRSAVGIVVDGFTWVKGRGSGGLKGGLQRKLGVGKRKIVSSERWRSGR